MPTITHKIGEQVTLPVQNVVTVKGRKSYVVRYNDCLCRVPLFDWQYDEDTPKELLCRLQAINDFDYPTFEQVAQQNEVDIIEPVKETSKQPSIIGRFRSLWKRDNNSCKKTEDTNTDESTTPSPKEPRNLDKLPIIEQINSEHNISLYRWSDQSDDFDKWLISTGGIKRRIEILHSIASQLAKYHRENKVYKDFSLEYITIKVQPNKQICVKLPATNYISSGLGNIFIYASHGAPEVVNRRMPNTPMSDCYSFAILVHELLNFCHPFIGDAVKTGEFSVEDAYKGKLPWIDNPEDKKNRLTWRKYDYYFTTPNIRSLYKRTFILGKDSPIERPTIHEWEEALYEAKNHLKYCPHCGTDYLYFEDGECAFCADEPDFPIAIDINHLEKRFDIEACSFSDSETEIYSEPEATFLVNEKNSLTITTRHLLVESKDECDILHISIDMKDDDGNIKLLLKPLNGTSFFAATVNKQLYGQKISRDTSVSFHLRNQRQLVLALKNIEIPQRVLVIKLNN